ncbi:MAG: cell division FtsA domain-containing protein [Patescibacteria group bacterium]
MKTNLIVLDIGTEFLKAMLLEVDKEQGILKDWVKESLNKVDVDNLEEVFLIFKKALKKLEKKSGVKTKNIFLGINNNFIRGISTNSCFKRDNEDQKINISELKKYVQRLKWKAFEDVGELLFKEQDCFDKKFKIIDTQVVDIKLDNESIINPLGFKGKNICLTVFSIYAFHSYLKQLFNIFSDFEIIGVSYTPYSLFHSLDLDFKKNCLIIDIGGKITEIILIKNNSEEINVKKFSLGGHSFTKELSQLLNINFNKAERIKLKYSKKNLKSKKIQELFESIAVFWFKGFRVVLDEYKTIPSDIFLCGEGSKLIEIKKILKKKGFNVKNIPKREILLENKTKLDNIPSLSLAQFALDYLENSVI